MSLFRDPDRLLSVTELGEELGISPRTIRFYESKSLLTPKRAGSTRVYGHRDWARLLIILRGKRLGFSLARIKDFLDLYDADPKHEEQLRLLLGGVRERIGELESQQRDLELTLEELREMEQQTTDALRQVGADPDEERA